MAIVDDQFEAFWLAFPRGRKTKKGDARRVFAAIVSGKHRDLKAGPAVLIAGAERYARAMGDHHPYVMMPSTWLHGGCWEDEDIAPPAPSRLPSVGRQSPSSTSTRLRSIDRDLLDRDWLEYNAKDGADGP